MITQKNNLGQTVQIRLELDNGEMAQPGIYLHRLLKTQDFEAWKSSPEQFKNWIADQMAAYFRNLQVVIVTSA